MEDFDCLLNTWQKVSQTQLPRNCSSLCNFVSYVPVELWPWNAEFKRIHHIFIQKFNLQTLWDCLQIASISHRDLMKKIWIKFDTVSLSCSMELFMNETILPFLINDYAFSGHPTLKNNYDDMNSETTWVTLDLPTDLFFRQSRFFSCSGSWDQYFPSVTAAFCASKLFFLFT